MGLRDRIKKRLKKASGLLNRVKEEANHPGRPQPHMAARNPLWGGAEDAPPPGVTPQSAVNTPPPAPAGVDPYATNNVAPDSEDDYWFLKNNDDEDWRATNPGATPGSDTEDGDD